VQVHQTLHIPQLQEDLLGIPMLLILLEEGSAVGQNILVSVLVDDPADLYQSFHVVLLLVKIDRLLVVLAGDQQLPRLLPVPVRPRPLRLLLVNAGQQVLVTGTLALAHADVTQRLVELLQLAEEFNSLGELSRLDVERSCLLVLPLIGEYICLEDIRIDLAVLLELIRILDGQFSEGEVFESHEAFLRNLKVLILECLHPKEPQVVIRHAQTRQFISHGVLLAFDVLDQRSRLGNVHHGDRVVLTDEQLEALEAEDVCLGFLSEWGKISRLDGDGAP
jgi:hypothetical protein